MGASLTSTLATPAQRRFRADRGVVGTQARRMPQSDVELIQRIAAGDGTAYLRVQRDVHRAFEQVWARLRYQFPDLHAERHDLMQSLELHLVGDNYRVLQTFRGEARLSTWLHAVAMRHVRREAIRLCRPRNKESAPLDPNQADQGTDPEVRAVRISERAEVQRVLSDLSDDERNLVAMFFEQGLDASQVARALGLSPAGVRMRKMRLLTRLQDKFRGDR